jgi:hypothetical protein
LEGIAYLLFRGLEEPAVRAFVEYFFQKIFKDDCYGERGTLRSRLNRFKDGCEAYNDSPAPWLMKRSA